MTHCVVTNPYMLRCSLYKYSLETTAETTAALIWIMLHSAARCLIAMSHSDCNAPILFWNPPVMWKLSHATLTANNRNEIRQNEVDLLHCTHFDYNQHLLSRGPKPRPVVNLHRQTSPRPGTQTWHPAACSSVHPAISPEPERPSHSSCGQTSRNLSQNPKPEMVPSPSPSRFLHQLQTSFVKLEHLLRPFLKTRSQDGSAHTFRSSLRFLDVPLKGVTKMIVWHFFTTFLTCLVLSDPLKLFQNSWELA